MRLVDLKLDVDGAIVRVQLKGEVDLSNARALRMRIGRLTSNQATAVILDLSQVEYLDSAGIHLIHRLRTDLRARGQKLALVVPTESPVHDVLRLAGLDWEDETARTVTDAERLVGQGTSESSSGVAQAADRRSADEGSAGSPFSVALRRWYSSSEISPLAKRRLRISSGGSGGVAWDPSAGRPPRASHTIPYTISAQNAIMPIDITSHQPHPQPVSCM